MRRGQKASRPTIPLIAALILLMILAPTSAAGPGDTVFLPLVTNSSATDSIPTTSSQANWETAVLEALNQVRAEHGLSPLVPSDPLGICAREHSIDMAENGCFSHTGCVDGSTIGQRETAAGYSWCRCGEIIAGGYSDVEQVVDAWMNSDGHRAIILNPDYVHFGAGWVDKPGSTYGIYWTVNFGTPL